MPKVSRYGNDSNLIYIWRHRYVRQYWKHMMHHVMTSHVCLRHTSFNTSRAKAYIATNLVPTTDDTAMTTPSLPADTIHNTSPTSSSSVVPPVPASSAQSNIFYAYALCLCRQCPCLTRTLSRALILLHLLFSSNASIQSWTPGV